MMFRSRCHQRVRRQLPLSSNLQSLDMDKNSRMSRLSVHPRYAPRESVWAGNAELYRGDNNAVCSPFLRECVMAMEDCCDEV